MRVTWQLVGFCQKGFLVEDGGNFASGAVVSSGMESLGANAGDFFIFSDKDVTNALTIAAGGLSGGLSSSIAGGNFYSHPFLL